MAFVHRPLLRPCDGHVRWWERTYGEGRLCQTAPRPGWARLPSNSPAARAQPHALRTGNLALALHAASGMDRVSLEDAFAICLLLRVDHARYERACVRWIERFAGEVDGVSLMDVYQASRVFQLLRRRPSKREVAPMVDVLRRHGLPRAADRLAALHRTSSG